MLSYIHFLLKTFSKRVSSYILVAIHLAAVFVLLVVYVNDFPSNDKGISFLSSISILMKFLPFVFTSVFSILVVTHIFKEGANGVEIMIVAKPITRKQIVASKFLVVFSLLLLHQVFIFIFYSLFSLYDSGASSTVRANWAISLALGGFIVQAIFVFIIILMASLVGKMGTAIIGILIAAIIPIFSLIITPLSLGQVSVDNVVRHKQSYVKNLWIDSEKSKDIKGGLSLYKSYDYDLGQNPEKHLPWTNYQKDKWYQDAYPFDIWYHWGRFMSLFTKDRIVDNEPFIQNLKIQDSIKINKNNEKNVFLQIGKKEDIDPNFPLRKYGLLLNLSTYDNKKMTEEKLNDLFDDYFKNKIKSKIKSDYDITSIKKLVAYIKGRFKISSGRSDFIDFSTFIGESLIQRLHLIDLQLTKIEEEWESAYESLDSKFRNIIRVVVYKFLSQEDSILTTSGKNILRINDAETKITLEKNENNLNTELKKFGLVQIYDDDKKNILGYTISSSPYASTRVVVTVWLLIGALLGGISIAIFLKKDFK